MKPIPFLVIITLAYCLSVTTANAIGDKEKGILIGVGSTILLNKVLTNDQNSQYYPHNPNGEFPPFRCNGDSVQCAYERGKWEREYEQWQKEKDKAYQCGRYGKCD